MLLLNIFQNVQVIIYISELTLYLMPHLNLCFSETTSLLQSDSAEKNILQICLLILTLN